MHSHHLKLWSTYLCVMERLGRAVAFTDSMVSFSIKINRSQGKGGYASTLRLERSLWKTASRNATPSRGHAKWCRQSHANLPTSHDLMIDPIRTNDYLMPLQQVAMKPTIGDNHEETQHTPVLAKQHVLPPFFRSHI